MVVIQVASSFVSANLGTEQYLTGGVRQIVFDRIIVVRSGLEVHVTKNMRCCWKGSYRVLKNFQRKVEGLNHGEIVVSVDCCKEAFAFVIFL